jgi:prepilin-type N-terminal cleavage/methylation domain-containing protein
MEENRPGGNWPYFCYQKRVCGVVFPSSLRRPHKTFRRIKPKPMLPSQPTSENLPPLAPRRRTKGFSLVEVVVSMGVLSIFAASALAAFTFMNRSAQVARLNTLATALVQEKIDEVSSAGWVSSQEVPAVLALGTVTEALFLNRNLAVENDTNRQSTVSTLDFQDAIPATRTTVVELVGGEAARLRRIIVRVTHEYRNVDYEMSMQTYRTTDDL